RALELEPQHRKAQALRQRLLRRGQEAKVEAVSETLCRDLRGALLKISFAIKSDLSAAEFFTLALLFLSLCHRGALLQWLKDFSAACEDLARVRELGTPGGPEAQEARQQLALTYDCAVHCYTLGRFDEAVMLLGKALRDERREKGLYVNRRGKSHLVAAADPFPHMLPLSKKDCPCCPEEQDWMPCPRNLG
ncbi:Tetratricopeptide repeat protein 16, partial [Fulmarus glacialis]